MSTDAPEDAELKQKSIYMFAGGVVMVLFQAMAAWAIGAGAVQPACANNDMCDSGQWCAYCGADEPLQVQTDTEGGKYNWAQEPGFVGFNHTAVQELCANPVVSDGLDFNGALVVYQPEGVRSWCDSCVSASTFDVNPLTTHTLVKANINSMGLFDYATLVLCSYVVALAVVGEVKDITLVGLAADHAGDSLSVGWRRAIRLVCGLRRWCVINCLLIIISALVLFEGGDALSVAFNTVAVLFILEVDNATFHHGLKESTKVRVETAGKVTLSDAEVDALARSKPVYEIMIVSMTLLCVVVGGSRGSRAMPIAMMTNWATEMVVRARDTSLDTQARAVAMAEATVAWVLSTFAFMALMGLFIQDNSDVVDNSATAFARSSSSEPPSVSG